MKLLSICILGVTLSTLSAVEDTVCKLPGGKEIVNPYLLDKTPVSITVGHRDGAVKLNLKDLPKTVQKKLGYNEKKALEYEENQKKQQAKLAEKAKELKKQNEVSEEKLRLEEARSFALQMQIKDLEDRLARQNTGITVSRRSSGYDFLAPGFNVFNDAYTWRYHRPRPPRPPHPRPPRPPKQPTKPHTKPGLPERMNVPPGPDVQK